MISEYNQNMGGVDKFHMLMALSTCVNKHKILHAYGILGTAAPMHQWLVTVQETPEPQEQKSKQSGAKKRLLATHRLCSVSC